MKTVAVIQARMRSTRLPGKVLRQLAGESVLAHVVARARGARKLDSIWIATTELAADAPIVAECERLGVGCFRGSEQDVLSRYSGAATASGAGTIVRITSDCPLFDSELLDEMLTVFHEVNQKVVTVDCLSNVIRRTYPRGLDTEIFTAAALKWADREAQPPHEREHVTPHFYQHPELFRLRSFEGAEDLSAHRWTLDTVEDWQFIEAVYGALYRKGTLFSTADVLKLLKSRSELSKVNAHVEQKKSG